MGQRQIRCIFCGLEGAPTREHVVPAWVRKRLGITTDVAIEVNSVVAQRERHLLVALRRKICATCNNGWLSQLEKSVEPYVSTMLTHEGDITLNVNQQRDLARWAIIKVLLMELALRQRRLTGRVQHGYTAAEVELAWLMNYADPPPRSRVWLGAFDAQQSQVVNFQSRLLGVGPAKPDGQQEVSAHVTTLTLGYLLLQVFTTDFVTADAQSQPQFSATIPAPLDQAAHRLWPPSIDCLNWPANIVIDTASLHGFAGWQLGDILSQGAATST